MEFEQSFNDCYCRHAREVLDEMLEHFTITDPSISGHPIMFASMGFLNMSGYSRDEVVGKSGGVFQGPGTYRRSMMQIREAIREERTLQVNLLNYCKDGRPFWMLFHMRPVFSKGDGRLVHFVAVQVPILRRKRRSGVRLCKEDGGSVVQEFVLGSCRKEVCSDSVLELGRVLSLDRVLCFG